MRRREDGIARRDVLEGVLLAVGVPQGGPNGQVMHTDGPRTRGPAQIGRISLAGQDSGGAPATEDAIWSGKRSAGEALHL